jgi:hypothetical protein
MSIKIPVTAELNQQAITQQVDQMRDALNNLGRVAQQAGKIKFNPINNVTLNAAKQMRAEFDAMVKMSPGLKRALEAGGQGGKKFDEVQWGQVWKDPNQRAAHAASMLRRLRPSSAEVLDPPKAEPSGTAGSRRRRRRSAEDDHEENRTPGTGGPKWKRAIAGGAAGIAGGVASQVGGLAGGVASGALTGGLMGGGIGAAVGSLTGAMSSVVGALGEAKDMAVSLDTLKRVLGDTGVSFSKLQDTTQSLANEFSLTDTEATSLTQQYARQAGSDKDLPGLRDEVGVGVGFSRSFGLDPSAGVGFFGQMKGLGITKNADDNKRLALMIGESVAKAGELPRMGDVLSGLSRYMESATGRTLGAANSEAWLSKLAGLSQMGLPGVTPGTAGNMIAKADNAVAQGGITEAGKNWMSGLLQKELGLTAIQASSQLEGGLFASGKSTFGEGTAIGRYNAQHGVEAPAAASSTRTNAEILMSALEKQYAGRSDLMLDAMKQQFGMPLSHAAAWQTAGSVKLGGMIGRLNRLGVDPGKVNATGISQLSQIEADGTLSSDQKDQLAKDAAGKNQEDTVGSEARKAAIDGGNAMVRLAEQGLPMLSSIQAGVLKLAGIDPLSPQKALLKAEHEKRAAEIDAKEGAERNAAVADYQAATPWAKRTTGLGLTDEQTQLKERAEAASATLLEARRNEDRRYAGERDKLDVTPSPATRSKAQPSGAPGLSKVEAEQGALLSAARADYEKITPEELRTPTAQLTDDQQMAKDRYDAAKVDYDDAVQKSSATEPTAATSSGPLRGAKPRESLQDYLKADPELAARLAKEDEALGHKSGTAAAQLWQESRFKAHALSNQGAMGHAQVMPANVAELSKRVGRNLNPSNFEDALLMRRLLMKENQNDPNIGRDLDRELMAYHGGPSGKAWGAKTRQYVNDVKQYIPGDDRVPGGRSAANDDRVPAIEMRKRAQETERREQSMAVHVHQTGEFILRDHGGNQVALADVQTRVGKPVASGNRL